MQEHSGIVIPVRGQTAMLGLFIGTIASRLERGQAGKSRAATPPTIIDGDRGALAPPSPQCGELATLGA
jgi:hypothetical protein